MELLGLAYFGPGVPLVVEDGVGLEILHKHVLPEGSQIEVRTYKSTVESRYESPPVGTSSSFFWFLYVHGSD